MTAVDEVSRGELLRRAPAPASRPGASAVRDRSVSLGERRQMRAPASPPDERRPRGTDRWQFTPAKSWSLAAAVPVALAIAVVVEPEANGPEPIAPIWLDTLAVLTLMAAVLAVGLLVAVEWSGVWIATFSNAGMVLLTALCPVSGHHVSGTYTYVQFAVFGALTAASLLVLIRCRPPAGSRDGSRLVV
ncbi:MAG TPA: hypothetical protein VFZ72_08310 [Jiangellaceae bacterium]